ncbi:hypothetical protein [Bacillus sp. 1NLA3E]|uniref:hypothetical protein n=1 Tax=Bacillus sp. 1NLA3E TaxID=666686 RepID=UPI000247EAF2|nr:hypothetical protein [Bacillus sp. 1NLA3E]AGK53169.1 hypothetical protein B1NLA3E_07025 [Bacillus sp. 1NLA3E]
MALIYIRKEIVPLKKHDMYGIEVIKAKEKLVLNSSFKAVYIDISSLAMAIDLKVNQLLEEISYSPITKEYLAYYRIEQKIIRVIDSQALNVLVRNLISAGYDFELLKTIRSQIYKTIEQMEKE